MQFKIQIAVYAHSFICKILIKKFCPLFIF